MLAKKGDAKQYMNLLARSLKVVNEFRGRYDQIVTLEGYCSFSIEVYDRLDKAWSKGIELFLNDVSSLLEEIVDNSEEKKTIQAYSVCIWMDEKIIYLPKNVEGRFSLFSLIEGYTSRPVVIGALNDNYEETGIWINPLMRIRGDYVNMDDDPSKDEKVSRNLANKIAFTGINRKLSNCCYFEWDGTRSVKNIVISDEKIVDRKNDTLKIAFAPMSSAFPGLCTDDTKVNRQGYSFEGVALRFPGTIDEVGERLTKDWLLACTKDIDVLFFPELLGTKELDGTGQMYVDWYLQMWENHKSDFSEEKAPLITVLPSYWEDGKNQATIVSRNGKVLGIQQKYEPYVSKERKRVEALKEVPCKETVIIHIPNFHRLTVIICSEFVADENASWKELVCGSLGVSVILVPSYSQSELDFINNLSKFECYDTTVVWGNACAAPSDKKGIGGCGIAGIHRPMVFGDVCTCIRSCGVDCACLFEVDIPHLTEAQKTTCADVGGFVKHWM